MNVSNVEYNFLHVTNQYDNATEDATSQFQEQTVCCEDAIQEK